MKIASFIFMVGLSSPAVAQDTTVTLWTREIIKSGHLSEDRPIYVVTPDGYRTSRNRYPVLIILDANDAPQIRSFARWRTSRSSPVETLFRRSSLSAFQTPEIERVT